MASLGQLSQLCPFPTSCPPQPTCCGGRAGKRESFDTVQELFSHSQNAGVLPALFFSQMQRTAPCGLLRRKLIPSHPDPTVIQNEYALLIQICGFSSKASFSHVCDPGPHLLHSIKSKPEQRINLFCNSYYWII